VTKHEIFVREIFAVLEKKDIPYVVIRNFESVFTADDVDILTAESGPVVAAMYSAAQTSGYALVQDAQFVNRSLVWWDGEEDFVRIDVETSMRWRVFCPIPTAKILSARVKRGDFWIPSPAHEAECLRVQLACSGKSQGRYRDRLRELGYPDTDPISERRRLALGVLINPEYLCRTAGFLIKDTRRLIKRLKDPVGASLCFAGAQHVSLEPLRAKLAVLFPEKKRPRANSEDASRKALFRGGLVTREICGARPADMATLLRRTQQQGSKARQFMIMAEPDGSLYMAHVGSGFMCSTHASEKSPNAVSEARFICRMLARNLQPRPVSPGRTVLFVGIDGAGKSTLARELLSHPEIQRRFAGARYFHWIPSGQGDFPWPAFEDRPRNTMKTSAFVSTLRLLRNLFRVWWSWTTNVKKLRRSGHLVILDRFVANYWLDPLSVRYSGPAAFLQMAAEWFPKADTIFILDAPAEILARRKNELSVSQIEKQCEALARLPALALRSVKLDASRPVDELVAKVVAELTVD